MRFLLSLLFSLQINASIFGEENIPLFRLVAGQIMELQRLAESVGLAKDQIRLLITINEGIERATSQINSMEAILQRAKGLDPKSIKKISDLTNQINELKALKAGVEDLVAIKLLLADQAIAQSALQSETAYKMGQEMIGTGTNLAIEAKTASPGRSAQIAASAQTANMLSQGVMLQTLSQMTQLEAMNLELKKTEMEKNLNIEKSRKLFFGSQVLKGGKVR